MAPSRDMPEFPRRPDENPPTVAEGLGGIRLRPETSEILRACGRVGPLFALFRNEACILGAVANPLRLLETVDVSLAAGGALTLNLAPREPSAVYSYVEPGPQGGFIDAIEFCGEADTGFLKLCRMEDTSRPRWQEMLANFRRQNVTSACIGGIQKTNHLNIPSPGGEPTSPASFLLDRFCDLAVDCGAALHVTAPAPGGRARLTVRPTHAARAGHWRVLCAEETAFHLAPVVVSELRVITRPHLALLVLLGPRGRLLTRIVTRHTDLLAKLPTIL